MRLEGKVATITGAGRGMGEAMARSFARYGASIVISDVDLEAAKAVAASIIKDGEAPMPFALMLPAKRTPGR